MPLLEFLVFRFFPRPVSRVLVAGLTFFSMVIRKQLIGPRNIQISLPSGCDHNCQFCITDIHGKGNPKNRNVLSFEELTTLVDSALSLGTLNINLVSTGEPTLYTKLPELIDHIYVRSRGRANIKIVTNATSLARFSQEDFRTKNVHLWVSLHAGDEAVWKSIHRPLAHEGTKFQAMKNWLTEFNEVSPGRVTLHNVVCSLNKDHLRTILEFAEETKSKSVFFGRLYEFPGLQLTSADEKDVLEKLKALAPEFDRRGIRTNIRNFEFVAVTSEESADDEGESSEPSVLASEAFYRTHDCYITTLFSPVDDTGNILSCGPGKIFGNVRDNSYQSIFTESAGAFLSETSKISQGETEVPGCRCDQCPHIQMNAEAHRYLKFFRS